MDLLDVGETTLKSVCTASLCARISLSRDVVAGSSIATRYQVTVIETMRDNAMVIAPRTRNHLKDLFLLCDDMGEKGMGRSAEEQSQALNDRRGDQITFDEVERVAI
jgi:hypothetical protein